MSIGKKLLFTKKYEVKNGLTIDLTAYKLCGVVLDGWQSGRMRRS